MFGITTISNLPIYFNSSILDLTYIIMKEITGSRGFSQVFSTMHNVCNSNEYFSRKLSMSTLQSVFLVLRVMDFSHSDCAKGYDSLYTKKHCKIYNPMLSLFFYHQAKTLYGQHTSFAELPTPFTLFADM